MTFSRSRAFDLLFSIYSVDLERRLLSTNPKVLCVCYSLCPTPCLCSTYFVHLEFRNRRRRLRIERAFPDAEEVHHTHVWRDVLDNPGRIFIDGELVRDEALRPWYFLAVGDPEETREMLSFVSHRYRWQG